MACSSDNQDILIPWSAFTTVWTKHTAIVYANSYGKVTRFCQVACSFGRQNGP